MPPDSRQLLGGLQRVKKNIQKQEYTKMKKKEQTSEVTNLDRTRERKKGAPVILAKGLGKEPHLLAFEIPVG